METFSLTHFLWDTTLVVSDTFGNNFKNTGDIEKYLIECCSEGPNNQLNLSIQSWAGFNEMMPLCAGPKAKAKSTVVK